MPVLQLRPRRTGPPRIRMVLGVNPAVPSWNPAQPLEGLLVEHWFRSDDAYQDVARTTPVASDGDVVGSLTDKSTSADHVSQATTGLKPTWQNGAGDKLNNHPAIRFDGIDDWLKGAFTVGGNMAQPNTIFAVVKLASGQVNDNALRFLVGGYDVSHRQDFYKDSAPSPDGWAVHGGAIITDATADANWNIWTGLFNGASSQLWLNGISKATGDAGAHGANGLIIGALYNGTNPANIDVVEILFYDANLSNASKNIVGQYLASRYGLSYTPIT